MYRSGDFGWSLARGSLKSSTGPTRDQGSSLDSGTAGREAAIFKFICQEIRSYHIEKVLSTLMKSSLLRTIGNVA
jgi:hypothetical protein